MNEFNIKKVRKNTVQKMITKMKYNKTITQLHEEILEQYEMDKDRILLLEELNNKLKTSKDKVKTVNEIKNKFKQLEKCSIKKKYLDLLFLKRQLRQEQYKEIDKTEYKVSSINEILRRKNKTNYSIINTKLIDQIKELEKYSLLFSYEQVTIISNLLYFISYPEDSCSKEVNPINEYIEKLKSEHYKTEYMIKVLPLLIKLEEINTKTGLSNNEQIELQELEMDYYRIIGVVYKSKRKSKNTNIIKCSTCVIDENMDKYDSHFYMTSEKYYVCTYCGKELERVIETDIKSLGYNELQGYERVAKFDYEKINYFTELLNKAQGCHNVEIDPEIINRILKEINKRNIIKLNYDNIRNILKVVGGSKYYDMIPSIIYKISGKKPMVLAPEIQEKLKTMFKQIQEPWEKHKMIIKDRKSSASYKYIFYKFFELLDLHEYLSFFPLLKSREKRHKLDVIWKKIIEEVQPLEPQLWIFHSSD